MAPGRIIALLKDAYRIASPYWHSEHSRRATGLLTAVVALNLSLVGTNILFTYWQGAFYNALEAKDWHAFLGSLLWWHRSEKSGFTLGFAPVLAAAVFITAYEVYLRQALQVEWREWMTSRYLDGWLSDRTYLRMAMRDPNTDNPDQRIAEDIRLYVENTLTLGLGLLGSIVSLFSFVFLLWRFSEPLSFMGMTIHGYLVWAALLYATAGTALVHRVGRRLTPLHFFQQKVEADYRFSLIRILENAEGIAFYGGESEERRELTSRFGALVRNWRAIMLVTRRLTFLTSGYAQVVLVFPLVVVAPAYFAGRMQLGGIFQTSNAFVQVQTALSWVVDKYSDLTGWFATVERLSRFRLSIAGFQAEHAARPAQDDGGQCLEFVGLNLLLPDGSRLLSDVHLRVEKGERVLLRGPSGVGKSTLLRALAGIWPFSSGTIRRPGGQQLFLPQRPYMPLGTLKRAACYPLSETDVPDSDLIAVLVESGLGHVVDQLHVVDVWERRLSGGEQQKLTIARALLIRPDWLFLDEATSALDPLAEAAVYSLLCDRLPGVTLISVAHREQVARFHTRVVSIECVSSLSQAG